MHMSWLAQDADELSRLQRECWCEQNIPSGYWFTSREQRSVQMQDTAYMIWCTAFCFFREEDWMNFVLVWQ
jgi:hypothetical protein